MTIPIIVRDTFTRPVSIDFPASLCQVQRLMHFNAKLDSRHVVVVAYAV